MVKNASTWRTLPPRVRHDAWFPGRLIGGAALVCAPIVFFAGLLLRHLVPYSAGFTDEQRAGFERQPFAAPGQLATYAAEPGLTIMAYSVFVAGAVLMAPAVITFARLVAVRCPKLAFWGGALTLAGLFARLYFAGVEQTAFLLVGQQGLERTTAAMMDMYVDVSYGLWRIPVSISVGQMAGMTLLAVGAYRAGVLGLVRGLVLPWAGWIWVGVLKESDLNGVLASAALAAVLVPIGLRILRDREPDLRTRTEDEPRTRPLTWW